MSEWFPTESCSIDPDNIDPHLEMPIFFFRLDKESKTLEEKMDELISTWHLLDVKEKSSTIAGIKGIIFTARVNPENNYNSRFPNNAPVKFAVFISDNEVYHLLGDLTDPESEWIFDQILSTFKFTNIQKSLDEQIETCHGIPNGSIVNESDTGRRFFGLPKNTYPYESLKFSFHNATAGEISGGDIQIDQNVCWEKYFEFDLTDTNQNGYIEIYVQSSDPTYPDYNARVNVWKYGENPDQKS